MCLFLIHVYFIFLEKPYPCVVNFLPVILLVSFPEHFTVVIKLFISVNILIFIYLTTHDL